MDPRDTSYFEADHNQLHERESMRQRLAAHGHVINIDIVSVDSDEPLSSGNCSCGQWSSKPIKANWIQTRGDEHLDRIDKMLSDAALTIPQ